ncbi:MAG: hypothetical protein N7Q72_02285, partial [Spiroplasma sp. Tabriz.8]|nr:hypothetical protein [Spiroplasma sp. Tabriz.8]
FVAVKKKKNEKILVALVFVTWLWSLIIKMSNNPFGFIYLFIYLFIYQYIVLYFIILNKILIIYKGKKSYF